VDRLLAAPEVAAAFELDSGGPIIYFQSTRGGPTYILHSTQSRSV